MHRRLKTKRWRRGGTGGGGEVYLNWVLLDEQFKVVTSSCGFEQVGASGATTIHVKSNLTISKSGYLYIYTSNEATNIDVFFDNLQVIHKPGPILEETQYYPFGLTMAGISSKAAGGLENKKKYQGYEYNADFDLNTYETFFRVHDPQIARWWQIDPKPESGLELSPYVVMNNNPISIIDPLGYVVEYERGEGVTKKEFRQFKREIRQMRRNSESFGNIYNGFKKDSRVFKYVATNTSSGGETKKTDKGYDMRISVHGKDPNQGGNIKNSTISQIAHETGHGFRKSNNLDGTEPVPVKGDFLNSPQKNLDIKNENARNLVNYNNNKELGASHIENIINGELINSGNKNYSTLQISATYFSGATLEATNLPWKPLSLVAVPGDLNKLSPPRTAEYYLNTKFNIYTEHGLQDPNN